MKRKKQKGWIVLFLLLGLALGRKTTEAHIDITPTESRPNRWQVYTLTVPTESSSPTIQVTINIPWGFEVEAIEHRPPWEFSAKRDAAGLIRDIVWTGGEIPPLTFEEFKFFVKAPKEKGGYTWTAYQGYADGKESTWNFQSLVKAKKNKSIGATGKGVVGPPLTPGETVQAQGKPTKKGSGQGGELLQRAKEATTLSYIALGISIVLVVLIFVTLRQNPRRT